MEGDEGRPERGAHGSAFRIEFVHRADPSACLIDRGRHVAFPAVREAEDVRRLGLRDRVAHGGGEDSAVRIVLALATIVVEGEQRVGLIGSWQWLKRHMGSLLEAGAFWA